MRTKKANAVVKQFKCSNEHTVEEVVAGYPHLDLLNISL